ncbi:MAG: response regulator [Arcobacteraceae bacterium]|nr:response regulator [Arcobacteraceae bacterium]
MNIEKLKNLRILYVEDEDQLRDTTAKSLNTIIPNITVALNGEDGLEKFNSGDFDLIITDLEMPLMSGVEMIKNIRNKNKNIPIIVTTAYDNKNSNIQEINKMGIDNYQMKPINMMELMKTINKYI